MYSSAAVVRREKVRNGLERTKLAIETGSDGTRMHKGARKRERDGKWSLRHILNSSRTEFQTSSPNRRHISGGWDLECHYVTRANLVFSSSQQLLLQKNIYEQVKKKKRLRSINKFYRGEKKGFNVNAHIWDSSTGIVTFHRFSLAIDEKLFKIPADIVVAQWTVN